VGIAEFSVDRADADWLDWEMWCGDVGVAPHDADPTMVVRWIDQRCEHVRHDVVTRQLGAISERFAADGRPDPTADAIVTAALARWEAAEPLQLQRCRPVGLELLDAMTGSAPRTGSGLRDHAMLLLGWWGALRRNTLVGLTLSKMTWAADTLWVALDDGPQAHPLGSAPVAQCAPLAVRRWVMELGFHQIHSGTLFRPVDQKGRPYGQRLNAGAVTMAVKRGAERCGLDPNEFSARSLRTGFIAEARRAGVPENVIAVRAGIPHRQRCTMSPEEVGVELLKQMGMFDEF
jgi:integrase